MAEKKVKVIVEMPQRLKIAGQKEAERRMQSLSELFRDYLKNFLPENIEKSISIIKR